MKKHNFSKHDILLTNRQDQRNSILSEHRVIWVYVEKLCQSNTSVLQIWNTLVWSDIWILMQSECSLVSNLIFFLLHWLGGKESGNRRCSHTFMTGISFCLNSHFIFLCVKPPSKQLFFLVYWAVKCVGDIHLFLVSWDASRKGRTLPKQR